MPDDRFAGRVLYSHPYYHARYQLVIRAEDGQPGCQEPLGVEDGVAIHGTEGCTIKSFPSTEMVLDAVATGKINRGYVISTRAPWIAQKRWPGKLAFLPAARPTVDCFPICAAVRKSDRDLKNAIDHVWDELTHTGQLTQALARWHITDQPDTVTETRKEQPR
jgi:hypothetical protein